MTYIIKSNFKSHLLAAVSATAVFLSAPDAFGQCTPNPPNPGDIVNCAPGVAYPGGISFAVDDLTVIVGDGGTPTNIASSGTGISLTGTAGDMNLYLYHPSSSVTSGGLTDGVYVSGSGAVNNVRVNLEGGVTGVINGVHVRNTGYDTTSVSLNYAIAYNARGVFAYTGANTTSFDLLVSGNVSGASDGVAVVHNGSGAAILNLADVTAASGTAVDARTYQSGAGLSVYLDTAYGTSGGINARSGGALTVSASDRVYTSGGIGVSAVATGNYNAGTINISTQEYVQGVTGGIYADHDGTGDIIIDAYLVTASAGNAISALSDGGNISISSTDNVNGSQSGITAIVAGGGNIGVTANGPVTGQTGYGIYAVGSTGTVTVTATDAVNGAAAGGAIRVNNGTGDVSLDVAGVTNIYGSNRLSNAIFVDTSGAINLTSLGTIRGQLSAVAFDQQAGGMGDIYVDLNVVNADYAVSSAYVNFLEAAIDITSANSGDIDLSVNQVFASNSNGINLTQNGDGDVTASVVNLETAGGYGLSATSVGAGNLNVSVSSSLVSNSAYGVGVRLTQIGAGTTTFTHSGALSGGTGLEITANTPSGDLTVSSTGSIAGSYQEAVRVLTFGTGVTSLYLNDVSGAAGYSDVYLLNSTYTTGLNLSLTGNHIGSETGVQINGPASRGYASVYVAAAGSGDINLITGGSITGTATNGIYVSSPTTSANLSVTTSFLGSVTGGEEGVVVDHNGSGAANLTFYNVSSGAGYADIMVDTAATTTDLNVTLGHISSGTDFGIAVNHPYATTANSAVFITHAGAGQLMLLSAGASANSGDAIAVYAPSSTTDVYLNAAGTTTGFDYGINIAHLGTGNLTVIAADVTGTRDNAINLHTGATSGALNVSVSGTLSGYFEGLELYHNGSGDIDLDVANVTCPYTGCPGIDIANNSDTAVTVTSSGTITAGRGILLSQQGPGTAGPVSITANNIYSSVRAVHFINFQAIDGGVNITTTGIVTGDIVLDFGAAVTNNTSPLDNAVEINTATSGIIDMDVYGTLTGSRFGIFTTTVNGTEIELHNTGYVTGGTAAIRTQGATASDVIYNSGVIAGDVLLLQGDDIFHQELLGTINTGTRVDLGPGDDIFNMQSGFGNVLGDIRGGLGSDSFNLSGSGTWGNQSGFTSSQVRQFETINVQSGADWVLEGPHFNYTNANFQSGSRTRLSSSGRLFADNIIVDSGGELILDANASLNRTLVEIDGTLHIGGEGTSGASSVQGAVIMGASGVLMVDAPAAGDNDLLRVTGIPAVNWGEMTLDGTLDLNQGFAATAGSYTIINAVNDLSGTFSGTIGLVSGAGLQQAVEYDYVRNRVNLVTSPTMMTPEGTGSKSSASAANYVLAQIGNGSDYTALGYDVGVIGSVAEIGDFAAGMTPDILDSAVMVSDGAALRFGQSLAGCDMNFSLNQSESCAATPGSGGPALFGEIRQTSANTGTEVGHSFNAQSFDMTFGVRLTDSDDATQFGVMSGYSKSGSVSDAFGANPTTPVTPAQTGAQADSPWIPSFEGMSGGESGTKLADGLEAETFSFGGYARRDLGWWSLDGTAMVSTSEAKLVRNITPGLGIAEQAQSEFVSRQFNLQGTATLNGLGSLEFWVKPLANVGNRTLQRDGFTESGADLLGLTVDGQTRNVSYAGVGAEVSPDFTDEQGNGFRGLLRVTGLAYAGDTESNFTARFTNAPSDSSFTYFGQNLDTSVLLEGGFQYIAADGFAIGAEGFGEFNPETGDSSTVGATLQLIKRW